MIRHADQTFIFLFFESSLRYCLNGAGNFELVHCFLFRTSHQNALSYGKQDSIRILFCCVSERSCAVCLNVAALCQISEEGGKGGWVRNLINTGYISRKPLVLFLGTLLQLQSS